jgi:hypothetical protein
VREGGKRMTVLHVLIAALIACLVTAVAGYWAGHSSGVQATETKWNKERLAAHRAADEARLRIAKIEEETTLQVRAISDAYTKEIRRRDAALSSSRRELDRLRLVIDAAATRDGRRPEAAANRPEVDGAAATAGVLLSACAGELVEMGGQAEHLAGQVISLQEYIRTLQKLD